MKMDERLQCMKEKTKAEVESIIKGIRDQESRSPARSGGEWNSLKEMGTPDKPTGQLENSNGQFSAERLRRQH